MATTGVLSQGLMLQEGKAGILEACHASLVDEDEGKSGQSNTPTVVGVGKGISMS